MGVLKQSARGKERYVAFEIEGGRLNDAEAKIAVYSGINSFLGEGGAAVANARVVFFDEIGQKGILKCERGEVERVKSALALITNFREKELHVRALGVSGTVRKGKEKFLKG